MARNRFLFDFLGVVLGLGIMIPMAIFLQTDSAGSLGFVALAVVLGGGVLGFLGYRNDGVKIAGIISGLIALFGIIIGVLMFTLGEDFANAIAQDIFSAFIGVIGGLVIIVVGIIFIVAMIVSSILFVGAAAIGSAIGEAVWKDKAGQQADVATQAYQPVQTPQAATAAYEPVQTPAKKAGEVFCTNCGATNVSSDEFCTSCGQKLKKA